MIVRKVSWFFRRVRSAEPAPRYLLPAVEFRELLRRERMRSDRSGSVFSLVAIELDEPEWRRGGERRIS